MKRAQGFWVLVVVAVVFSSWSQIGSAQGADGKDNPTIGTWKLNVAKSKYNPGPPPKNQTIAIEARGADGQKATADGVLADGSRVAYSYTANYDGKDYPYMTGAVGTPNGADTIAIKRIDAYTFEITGKR